MFYEIIAVARDWSILILALPILVALAVQIFLMWHVTRALLSFAPRVRPALRAASREIVRAADSVDAVRRGIESPVLAARAAPARVMGFLRALRGGKNRRR
ncbi:MAG: hypothetical protein ACYCYF_11205 [Anaerolineae bacterium]